MESISGSVGPRFDEVLSPGAIEFVTDLQRRFGPTRERLLLLRGVRRQQAVSTGKLDFLPETRHIRDDPTWKVASPADLLDRRVEITGPTDRKMMVNAMNSGARVFMADFEDANTPTWENMVEGQINLVDAIEREIEFTSPDGKQYVLQEEVATLMPRPRGWHLVEKHFLVDDSAISASLFDFGLFVFHNTHRLLRRGTRPYLYLPKIQGHLEARLWNEVFEHAEASLGVPSGTIRATVLIETVPAAFEMDEILYELRDHSYGLNAGRWDYMFSMIKTFRERGVDFLLPDRNSVTMTVPFMRAYTELLVQTCHKRGAFAMGGMAAFVPSRRDEELNRRAMTMVRADKEREATDGFDGTWVAHPDLVPVAKAVFDEILGDRPNQLDRQRPEVHVRPDQLLAVTETPGAVTTSGLRNNVCVGLQYIESWLAGRGAVAISNLMEDVATAEIARSQVWQWVHNQVPLSDTGEQITPDMVRRVIDEELQTLGTQLGEERIESGRFKEARMLFEQTALEEEFPEFLTLPAYGFLA